MMTSMVVVVGRARIKKVSEECRAEEARAPGKLFLFSRDKNGAGCKSTWD